MQNRRPSQRAGPRGGWGEETHSHQQWAAIDKLLITAKVSGKSRVKPFSGWSLPTLTAALKGE